MCLSVAVLSVTLFLPATAQKKTKTPEPPPPMAAKGGHLVYAPAANGDQVPDFSYSGYKGGGAPIPDVSVKVTVPLKTGDATMRIQAALDFIGTLPADRQGIRGAVLLEKGVYEVGGSLLIRHSGVILRGSGMGEGGTILLAATFVFRGLTPSTRGIRSSSIVLRRRNGSINWVWRPLAAASPHWAGNRDKEMSFGTGRS